MTPIDSNTFPRQVEEPRTNLLRDANWPPPFYREAVRIVDEQNRSEHGWARQFDTGGDRVEQVRVALAHRAFMRDTEPLRRAQVSAMALLEPKTYAVVGSDGVVSWYRRECPPETAALLRRIDAMIESIARQYGLTLKPPESEIRRD